MTCPTVDPATCEPFRPDLPELAVGILPGRRRAEVLAHLEGCAACRAEVEQLTVVADSVLLAAPEAEPSPRFDEELARRIGMGVAPVARVGSARPGRLRTRRPVLLAVAAAVVALALALGITAMVSSGGTGRPPATVVGPDRVHSVLTSAPLVRRGSTVGRMRTYGSGYDGSAGWLAITIWGHGWQGTIHCRVHLADGSNLVVGPFALDPDGGSWGVELPRGAAVTSLEVLGAGGRVLATTT
jgi:hypothetical protein